MRNQAALIDALSKLSGRQRKQFLQRVNDEFINALGEGSLNIIKGNVPLTQDQYKKLKRHRSHLKALSNKRLPIRTRRQIVEQKGGFVGLLASILVPTIASLVGSAIGS
jgi:hypothetical protein